METYKDSTDIRVYLSKEELSLVTSNKYDSDEPFMTSCIDSMLIDSETERILGKIRLYGPNGHKSEVVKTDKEEGINNETLHIQLGRDAYERLILIGFYNENSKVFYEGLDEVLNLVYHESENSEGTYSRLPIRFIVNDFKR